MPEVWNRCRSELSVTSSCFSTGSAPVEIRDCDSMAPGPIPFGIVSSTGKGSIYTQASTKTWSEEVHPIVHRSVLITTVSGSTVHRSP